MNDRKNDISFSNSQNKLLKKKLNGINENKIIKVNTGVKKTISAKNVKKNGLITNHKIEETKK